TAGHESEIRALHEQIIALTGQSEEDKRELAQREAAIERLRAAAREREEIDAQRSLDVEQALTARSSAELESLRAEKESLVERHAIELRQLHDEMAVQTEQLDERKRQLARSEAELEQHRVAAKEREELAAGLQAEHGQALSQATDALEQLRTEHDNLRAQHE